MACGHTHALALSDEGILYVWGGNSYGQLGIGNKTNACSPVKVSHLIIATQREAGRGSQRNRLQNFHN